MCIAMSFTRASGDGADAPMTPRQVARLLQIDVDTVKLWGRLGVLKDGFSPGGPGRFRRVDILTFLSGRSTKRPGGRRACLTPAGISLS